MKISEITYRVYVEEGNNEPPWELVYKDIDAIGEEEEND